MSEFDWTKFHSIIGMITPQFGREGRPADFGLATFLCSGPANGRDRLRLKASPYPQPQSPP